MTENIPTPLKILRNNVSILEVARYYLEVEFSKLFPNASSETITEGIINLKDRNILPLLEAMSFTYHLNGVFYNITREGYIWREEVWDIDKVILTSMDSNINKIIFSEEIAGNAIKFRDYLINYFNDHGGEDPEGLFSYKPSQRAIAFPKLLMTEKEDKIQMLDGSHRLTEMLLNNVQTVEAFVGHPVSDKNYKDRKTNIGASTFILLTICFKNGNDHERDAVITLAKQLINRSFDGREMLQKYWIDRQTDDDIKNAGKLIIEGTK